MAHEISVIDGQASFVSANGEDAWHRLGTVVPQEGLTAAEVMDLAHLGGWNVRKRPLFTEDEEGNTLVVPDRVAIVRDNPIRKGQVDVIAPAGKDYGIIQNEQHAQFLDTLVDESGAHFTTAGALYENGRQVFITMKLPGHISIGGDRVDNYIAAVNSHDGSLAFSVMVTPVRVVCANTLNFALGNHSHMFRVRHTSNALKGAAQAARDALDMTFEYLDDFQEIGRQLLDQTMTQSRFEEMIEKEFGAGEDASAATVTRSLKRIEKLEELFAEAQTQEGIRDTKWAAVNALTEWWDHHSPTRGDDADTVRARKALLSTRFKNHALKLVMSA